MNVISEYINIEDDNTRKESVQEDDKEKKKKMYEYIEKSGKQDFLKQKHITA